VSGRPDRQDRPGTGERRPAAAGSGRPDRSTGRPAQGARPGRASGGPDQGRRAELEARTYDPRREERRKHTRLAVPEDVDARELDPDVRRELRSLTRETADLVARHLVMTGRLLDDDPEQALAHGRAARAMAGRIGVVREACGLAAYAAGEWNEALADLRAARRITGQAGHLAVLADCERALGRPERALALAEDPDVRSLDQAERVELVIVVSGARRDLGQADAAVLTLQEPARRTSASRPWAARLWYAYADALLHAARLDEARTWFDKVVGVDEDGLTDAGDRLLALDGVVLEDLDDEAEEHGGGGGLPDEELAAYVAQAFPRPTAAAQEQDEPAAPEPAEAPAAEPGPSSVASPVFAAEAAPEAPETSRQAAGPAPLPVFASPPAEPGDDREDEDR
jgi:tetratricopeptide (TPR) repeat protein